MLDIHDIKKNKEAYKNAAKVKNIEVDIDKLLSLYEEKNNIKKQIEELQNKKNLIAKKNADSKDLDKSIIEEGKKIKEKIATLNDKLKAIEEEYEELMCMVPVIPSEDTPIGKDDNDNVEIYRWGEIPKFDFEPKDHIELGKILDILDLEKGAEVAGYRGYYVKNEGVLLMLGFLMYALQKLVSKGYQPMIVPTIVREFVLWGSGYFAKRHYNPEIDEIYQIATSDKEADGSTSKEKKFLIGTAEPSLLAYFSNEVLDIKDLPIKLCGFSPCYRSEIGSYGKDVRGLYRVHEFLKIEQVAITPADISIADEIHMEMLNNSKELHEELGLPYRVIQLCTGDMGKGKYKMFDIEAWIPSRGKYGETGSASNLKDFQSRRLNVKYKDKNGEKKYVYMLNDTALASPRTFIAIIENYQQKDGSVKVPDVLIPFVGKDIIYPKK